MTYGKREFQPILHNSKIWRVIHLISELSDLTVLAAYDSTEAHQHIDLSLRHVRAPLKVVQLATGNGVPASRA